MEQQNTARVTYQLVDSGYARDVRQVIYAFRVKISNPAREANSLIHADLLIRYTTITGVELANHISAEVASTRQVLKWNNIEHLDVPLNIRARSAFEGFLSFAVPISFFKDLYIDNFSLVFEDFDGPVEAFSTILVEETSITNE